MRKVWAELALQFPQYPFHKQAPAGLPAPRKKPQTQKAAAGSGLPSECISGRFMWVIY